MGADVNTSDPLADTDRADTAATTGPTKTWYYLTLVFLVGFTLYFLAFVTLESISPLSTAEFDLLLWLGVFGGFVPLAVFFWLDTRAVARANRNPAFVERSYLLRPWLTGGSGVGVGTLVRGAVLVVVGLFVLVFQFVLPFIVAWYVGVTRRKALRAPAEPPAVSPRDPPEDARTDPPADAQGDSPGDAAADSDSTDASPDDSTESSRSPNGSQKEPAEDSAADLPPLPPRLYRQAKRRKQAGRDHETAGETAFAAGDYAAATAAYADAVTAYADAVDLVDGYDVDDSALRADQRRAEERHEEVSSFGATKSLDDYLAEARERAHEGDERYAAGDFDGAIEQWGAAATVYDRALSVAPADDAGDIRTLQQDLRAKVTVTDGERETARQRDAEMAADDALSRARRALEADEFAAAQTAFAEAVESLDTALEIATEQDRDASYLGEAKRDARRGVVDATLGALEADLLRAHTDERTSHGTRAVVERVRRELNDLEAGASEVFTDDHHDRVARLRERVVIETLSESVTGQLAEMERAERLFGAEKFFEAREVYRRVKANVGTLATEHATTLTEDVEDELSRVQLACEMNTETITKAIHGDVGESLVTVGDIKNGGPIIQDSDSIIDRVIKANLPAYTRERLLGGGGFADIWVVKSGEGRAAVKIPRVHDYETIPESKIRRFVAEAENWQRVSGHPNVVEVLQYGEKPVPWILLELCDGTLRGRLDAGTDFDDRVVVLAAVGDALGYANAMGIAHLDIKPENVLFDADGVAKLGDWGLSKVMTEGTITVTGHSLDYAAPEQRDRALGERDIRTDVYQYGVLAYELLTGKHPFTVGSPEQLVRPSEVNPELPASVDDTLLKAMAYRQDERYEQVVQVRDALTRALGVEA